MKDEQKVVAWFYHVLRNVIGDHVRSRSAATRRDEAWTCDTVTLSDDADAERHIGACFEKLLRH